MGWLPSPTGVSDEVNRSFYECSAIADAMLVSFLPAKVRPPVSGISLAVVGKVGGTTLPSATCQAL